MLKKKEPPLTDPELDRLLKLLNKNIKKQNQFLDQILKKIDEVSQED